MRAGRRDREFPVFHPFCPDEPVCHPLDLLRPPPHNEDFEAVVPIQVDVHAGDDGVVGMVLQVGEGVGQFSRIMRIDDRDGPDRFSAVDLPFFFDQCVADKVPDRLAPARVFLILDKTIKSLKSWFSSDMPNRVRGMVTRIVILVTLYHRDTHLSRRLPRNLMEGKKGMKPPSVFGRGPLDLDLPAFESSLSSAGRCRGGLLEDGPRTPPPPPRRAS